MQTAIEPHDLALMSAELQSTEERNARSSAHRDQLPADAVLVQDAAPDWTDAELDTAILVLCDENPPVRMVTCWRALEHCRRHTPRGTPASLLVEMRHVLRLDMQTHPAFGHRSVAGR
jgi:hypothetical protein